MVKRPRKPRHVQADQLLEALAPCVTASLTQLSSLSDRDLERVVAAAPQLGAAAENLSRNLAAAGARLGLQVLRTASPKTVTIHAAEAAAVH